MRRENLTLHWISPVHNCDISDRFALALSFFEGMEGNAIYLAFPLP